jgi:hypothetical protein
VWWYGVDVGVEYEMCTDAVRCSSRGKDIPNLINVRVMALFPEFFNEE